MSPYTRYLWLTLGVVCCLLGVIGALLPLMPTTIFLILAAACFARSHPEWHRALLEHPHFGPSLRLWETQRAFTPAGKRAALIGIAAGFALSIWLMAGHPWLQAGLFAFGALLATWVARRPSIAKLAMTKK
ncbi:YbaN family protein [Crenobacter cavernae]|uniref:DUF454 domain-containing protein n=1 Tax=Crenobacter cavernae TaxID=2290923 RepID=A0A345Y7W6_9NEIS|nr:YbaN family protein [Crenobacter cavernae]AXK40018.1 DUF454 domain-containing protein [Crenobacter cavernae]